MPPSRSYCRHAAALVSRRWHDCAHAPELCRKVAPHLPQQRPAAQTAALQSLAAWLLRHSQHVRSLDLELHDDSGPENEQMAQLACCLMACASGPMEELFPVWTPQLLAAAWAPALRSLRWLRLDSLDQELVISRSLHGLTQLTG